MQLTYSGDEKFTHNITGRTGRKKRPLLRCKYQTEMEFRVEGVSVKLKFTLE
jgi:hypothetical protein